MNDNDIEEPVHHDYFQADEVTAYLYLNRSWKEVTVHKPEIGYSLEFNPDDPSEVVDIELDRRLDFDLISWVEPAKCEHLEDELKELTYDECDIGLLNDIDEHLRDWLETEIICLWEQSH